MTASRNDFLRATQRLTNKAFLVSKVRQLGRKPTPAESVFQRKLQEAGFDFIFQSEYRSNGFIGIVDFWLKGYKVFIEIDGGYHTEEEQQQKDRIKDWICQSKLNKPILRFTNSQAMYLSIDQIKVLVDNFFVKVKGGSPNRLRNLQSWRDGRIRHLEVKTS